MSKKKPVKSKSHWIVWLSIVWSKKWGTADFSEIDLVNLDVSQVDTEDGFYVHTPLK